MMFGAPAQDVRHALRLIRREPAFTFTALATLALGHDRNVVIEDPHALRDGAI